jgi:hypothetical protein
MPRASLDAMLAEAEATAAKPPSNPLGSSAARLALCPRQAHPID